MIYYFGFWVHFRILTLIIKLCAEKVVRSASQWISSVSFKLFYVVSCTWIYHFAVQLTSGIKHPSVKRKLAVVILTKISTRDYPRPELTTKLGKQNAYFLERIMTEKLAFTLTNLKKEFAKNGQDLSLYICYQNRYFYKYNISDWLEHLPDYSKRHMLANEFSSVASRFDKLKELFEKNSSKLDLSFDADSFCEMKPLKCCKAEKSIFRYICVEDTEDGRALEAAIRVGFYHDNQDVVVLNPHAVEISEVHIKDAFSYLEDNVNLKNRYICGVTSSGSLYLIGVSRSRDVLLNLRRLTNNVIWGSPTAHKIISEHEAMLNWNSACLRPILGDVNGIESLPLVEKELGLQMEYIPNDLVTVILPTFNHEDYVESTLESLVHHISGKRSIQIVAIDAASTDYTVKKLEEFKSNLHKYLSASTTYTTKGQNVTLKNCLQSKLKSNSSDTVYHYLDINSLINMEIYCLSPGVFRCREEQVRYAVKHFVKGATVLVLRPGTNLPLFWDLTIRRCLNKLGVIMGTFSFHMHLDDRYVERKNIGWALRCYLMNWIFNVRSDRFELPSGDQGFFMYTYYYKLLNYGQTRIDPPIIDDVALVERVRAAGHISTAEAPVTVCPIRALQFGFLRCCLLDWLVIIAFRLGGNPEELEYFCKDLMVVKPDYFDGY